MPVLTTVQIAFIGSGNMARSLIGGLINKGANAANILACDPSQEAREGLTRQWPGLRTSADNTPALEADIVILAVKPQVMDKVCTQLQVNDTASPLFFSIAAGIPLSSLQGWLGDSAAIVRCMPNTPALVQLGATGYFANEQVSKNGRELAATILSAVGMAIELANEEQLDSVTALSGSGPAYFFLLMESMIKAGTALGLDVETARQLTLQTALGAATMATNSEHSPEILRQNVTSPGGTTEAALKQFANQGFEEGVLKAMQAAADRSIELSSGDSK
jgi:pyrroline-5-carboxylate reductase